jgi:hypothetical protein
MLCCRHVCTGAADHPIASKCRRCIMNAMLLGMQQYCTCFHCRCWLGGVCMAAAAVTTAAWQQGVLWSLDACVLSFRVYSQLGTVAHAWWDCTAHCLQRRLPLSLLRLVWACTPLVPFVHSHVCWSLLYVVGERDHIPSCCAGRIGTAMCSGFGQGLALPMALAIMECCVPTALMCTWDGRRRQSIGCCKLYQWESGAHLCFLGGSGAALVACVDCLALWATVRWHAAKEKLRACPHPF